MKKIFPALLLLMALVFVGCQGNPDAPKQDASKTNQSSQPTQGSQSPTSNQNTGST